MKLLVVTHNYPRFPGDRPGSFIATQVRALGEQGVTCRVVAPDCPGVVSMEGVDRFPWSYGITEAFGLKALRSSIAFSDVPFLLGSYAWNFARAVRKAVKSFKPDLIHAHWWIPSGLVTSLFGQTPYILTSHGTDAGWWLPLRRRVFRKAEWVTGVSRYVADRIEHHGHRFGASVIPMPIDTSVFGKLEHRPVSPPRILFVGALDKQKRVDVFLEALRYLQFWNIRVQAKIIGDGERPNADDLQVTWSGFLSQRELAQEYAETTVLVLPSEREGLGMVLAEALVSGCAVVGTDNGGIPDIVQNEQTGLLFRKGDARHLAQQIHRMLWDHAARERWTAAGKAHVLEHFGDSLGKRWLQLYNDALWYRPSRLVSGWAEY